jgi:ABC-type transport system involved in cytochrome c biogenesis permease subunit
LLVGPGLGYLAASIVVFVRQLTRTEALAKAPFVLVWVSLAAHVTLLGLRVYQVPAAPFTGAREFAVLLALLLVIAYLLTANWLRGVGIAGVTLAVAGLALLAIAPTLPAQPQPAPAVLMSPWLLLHVPLCLLSYLMYALAGCGSAMYLVVSRLLKTRRPVAISRSMPTLDSLERFSHRMAELGFPLLTAGIMAGMMWSRSAWGELLPETPKQIIALVSWGIYAAYFHARLVRGIRGRTCAWLLVLGFLAVVVGLLVPAIAGGPHKFI